MSAPGKRAWTPGPWKPLIDPFDREEGSVGCSAAFQITREQRDARHANGMAAARADAELIALAPEMAEAILYCDTLPIIQNHLKPIIDKLRKIGADDE